MSMNLFLVILSGLLVMAGLSLLLREDKESVSKNKKSKISLLVGAALIGVSVTILLTANHSADEQYKEILYTLAAEQGIDQPTADAIDIQYKGKEIPEKNSFEYVSPEVKIELYLAKQARINKAKERVELFEAALKAHNNAVAKAEGKLTGDLSCYTISFINDKAEQAAQTGAVIDLDCEKALIDDDFKTIEEKISEAKEDLKHTEIFGFSASETTLEYYLSEEQNEMEPKDTIQ